MQMQKDVHLTGKDLTKMVQLRPDDVGKYAIVPGPKDRLDALMKKVENPVRNFSFMEYTMYTGMYNGIKITGINGGRFSTDTSMFDASTSEFTRPMGLFCLSTETWTLLGFHPPSAVEPVCQIDPKWFFAQRVTPAVECPRRSARLIR